MRKKLVKIVFIIVIIALLLILGKCIITNLQSKPASKPEEKELDLTEVKEKYSPYVKTIKATSLYQKKEGKFIKKGTVEAGVTLMINTERELPLTEESFYFPLRDMNYFVFYKDIEVGEEQVIDQTYKNYIVFNENVTTSESTKFYKDQKLLFTLPESIDLPIIIKDTDYYYVEYADQLLGVKKDEVNVQPHENTSHEIAPSIAALNYHFFYDETNRSECQQIICHHVDQFRSHLNYFKENGYYTLKMHDMELFVDGKIRLPKKSVLITIDDGWLAEKGIALLNEYQMNATVFLITSSYLPEGFTSSYVEAHSHGDNLHFAGACPGGQGGAIKCYEEEKLLKDLALSREKLHGSNVFCYPFYEYNDYAISILQKAGFKMAFIGGNKKIKVGDNKMLLTRYPILSTTTVNALARIVNN